MKSAKLYAVVLYGALAACGSGSSGSSTGGAFIISPGSATVAAGSTQQFAVSGGNGGSVTWAVNGINGGNGNVGIISASGLYTAPSIPPVVQPLTITATQTANMGSATVIDTYSNVTLDDQFIFTFTELQGGVATNAVGLFTANGNGSITGNEDVDGPAGYFTVPVTGHYSLSANGQGTLTIDGGAAGTLTLTVSLVAGAAEGVLTDATAGRVGGGILYPQAGTLNSASALNGNYTINLGSSVFASNDNSMGFLNLSAPSITAGYMDENNGGVYTQSGTVSGSYTVGSGNRGTLSLSVNGGITTSNYVFYVVSLSPNQLELMCIDPGCVNSGNMNTQTTQIVTSGTYVLQLEGISTGLMPDALLATGSITSPSDTGGTANLTMYENDNGTYVSTNGSTVYTVPGMGRGLITIPTPFGNRNFVFYVESAGNLNVLESSSGFGNTAGGALAVQGNAVVVSGQYLFYFASQVPSSQNVSTAQAILQVAQSGQVTGQEVLNANGVISTITVSGTITAQQPAGTYTLMLNLGGGLTASYVVVANAAGVLTAIGSDTDEVSAGGIIIQHTTP